jgi:hypothetical protein
MGEVMNEQEWVLMNPVADVGTQEFKPAARIPDLKGKTVGLLWNGKPNGDVFLNEVATQLGAIFDGLKIVRMWEVKPETMTLYGSSMNDMEFIAKQADFIICASAD